MAAQPDRLSLLGMPPEVRHCIYRHLFAGLELNLLNFENPPDRQYLHDNIFGDEKHSNPDLVTASTKSYVAATTIFLVDKQIHTEALPLFGENLGLHITYSAQLEHAKRSQFLRNAKYVKISMSRASNDTGLGVQDVRRHLPKAKRITYRLKNALFWDRSLQCSSWNDLFGILKGDKDADLVKDLWKNKNMSYGLPSFLETALTWSSPQSPQSCQVILQFGHLPISWSIEDAKKLPLLYRIDIDLLQSKVIHRAINFGYCVLFAQEWVPAEGVLILRDGLTRPTLFRSDNGELRVLMGVDDFGFARPLDEEDRKNKVYPGNLDFQKRRKVVNARLTNLAAIEDSEGQLSDETVLQHAVESAERCVQDQTVEALADAVKVRATIT